MEPKVQQFFNFECVSRGNLDLFAASQSLHKRAFITSGTLAAIVQGIKPVDKAAESHFITTDLPATVRETELAAEYPIHVVCAWLGNTAAIAARHYLTVREEDYARAVQVPVQMNRDAKSGAAANGREWQGS